ncbi:MAG TPA: extracellular solute-binding protein [Planctomycetota bacterium]|jgi:spermidine/putrescine-binding protein|nr:extracellular solute-binding protein [Planctomycetota bacterium]
MQSFKGQTLVVTSYGNPWQQFMIDEHIPQFEAETGAKVELAIGLAKDWFAKMQAAGKSNPPYDVFVTNETYLAQLRAEGFFAPLPMDKVPRGRPRRAPGVKPLTVGEGRHGLGPGEWRVYFCS